MDRKEFLRLSGLAGCGGLVSGCESLDTLADMPEGAGIQIISAAAYLAKYRATQRQRSQAAERGARIYAAKALKPAAEKKIAAVRAEARKPKVKADPAKAAELEREEAVLVSTYHAELQRIGARSTAGLRIRGAAPTDIPPDPSVRTELNALGKRQIGPLLAMRVDGAGNPAETAGTRTVVLYDTRRQAAGSTAFVLAEPPRSGERIELDGARAEFHN